MNWLMFQWHKFRYNLALRRIGWARGRIKRDKVLIILEQHLAFKIEMKVGGWVPRIRGGWGSP